MQTSSHTHHLDHIPIEMSLLPLHSDNGGPSSVPAPRPNGDKGKQPAAGGTDEAGKQGYDYTENAPQAVVDAIFIERKREEEEGPPDMMVGSWASWMNNDGAGAPP